MRNNKQHGADSPPPLTSEELLRRRLSSYEQSKPHSARERKEYEVLKRLQDTTERRRRGEISDAESASVLREEREHNPFIAPPPDWLPHDLAELIIAGIRFLGGDSGKEKFLRWVQDSLAEPKGRPTKGELTGVYKEAARLKQTLDRNGKPLSWLTIARKVCPQRKENGHKCTKLCVDRIRMGSAQYM